MKIVTKIVLLVIISVSVIMGGASLLISNRVQQSVHTQINRVLATNLEFVAKDIVKTTEHIRRTAEIIAHNRAIRTSLSLSVSRGVNQILNDLVAIYPFFNFFVIAEPNGDIFAASTRDKEGRKVGGEKLLGLNIKENPMIKENLEIMENLKNFMATSKKVTFGRPGRDPYLELMGMKHGESQWFVAPVHVRGGLIGWVVLSYDWKDEMSALLKNITKHLVDIGNPAIKTILINQDGQIVAGDSAGHGKFKPGPSILWKSRQVMVGNAPMKLIIVYDRTKSDATLVKTRDLLLAIVLISSIALIVILYFLLRQTLLRRLKILHEGTLQLGKGNLSTRLPGLGNDEIGSLASAFNHMAKWLQSTTVSRDYMDNILESITNGVITINDKGLITTYNAAARKMFGYEGDEVIGRNISILLPLSDRKDHEYYTNTSRIYAPRIISLHRDLEGRRKDGSLFPMELIVTPMEMEGKRGFVGAIRDITEHKEIARMKNAFVSTVSHELRTPLTSIKGSLGMIAAGALGELPEKAKGMIDIAHKNTERLINLVNGILDMEKLESGRMAFAFGEVDLADLVKQSIEDNKGYAKEHDVSFELKDAASGALVKADADRIAQVMANLLSNAAKFSPQGGKVEVSVSRHDGALRVSVTDHGPGVPEDFRDKIFGRFTQADTSDARQKGGTGLGLNISKSIIAEHDGRLWFESEPGAGATFHFDLPELAERIDAS